MTKTHRIICMETIHRRIIGTVGDNVKCLPYYLEYVEVSINTTYYHNWVSLVTQK